jgi:hypothetical protein
MNKIDSSSSSSSSNSSIILTLTAAQGGGGTPENSYLCQTNQHYKADASCYQQAAALPPDLLLITE